jgi:adenine/guanine phosphoribosyltransferase-like PRPP-binding protein
VPIPRRIILGSGERLSEGTCAHVIEDFVHTGATLDAAVKALRSVGLVVPTASSVLISPPETIADAIAELDIHLTALVATNELGN